MPEEDPAISKIFYHFQEYTTLQSGRTFGRKLGVIQEVLVRKLLEKSDSVRSRLYLEEKLEGYNGAAHKVEFAIFPVLARQPLLGAGRFGQGDVEVEMSGEWRTSARESTDISVNGCKFTLQKSKSPPLKIRKLLARRNLDLRINREGENSYVDLLSKASALVSIESKRVGAQRFSGSDKLGAGIQTIEKAKQASLVALDIDLRINRTIKPLGAKKPRRCISCVVLGNGVHWDDKDRAVLGTYVDYVFLLPDELIIRYADFIKFLAAAKGRDFLQFLMSYFQGMTKMVPDEFVVEDADLICLEPKANKPGLLPVLERHINSLNSI